MPKDQCDFIRGTWREGSRTGPFKGVLNLTKALGEHLHSGHDTAAVEEPGQRAYACYELGLVTCRDPDTVRCPPVSVFIGGEAFAEMDREVTESRPGLVIELATSNQRRAEMAERVLEWHAWGVPCVWIVNSLDKSVHVAERGQVVQVRSTAERLSGTPVLPGLEFAVKDLFVEPEWWTR